MDIRKKYFALEKVTITEDTVVKQIRGHAMNITSVLLEESETVLKSDFRIFSQFTDQIIYSKNLTTQDQSKKEKFGWVEEITVKVFNKLYKLFQIYILLPRESPTFQKWVDLKRQFFTINCLEYLDAVNKYYGDKEDLFTIDDIKTMESYINNHGEIEELYKEASYEVQRI